MAGRAAVAFAVLAGVEATLLRSEVLSRSEVVAKGVVWRGNSSTHNALLKVDVASLPADFTWCNKDGVSYCTASRNQHAPHYCGACWAHAALSALADRVKIARGGNGVEIVPAVQHLLNCGGAGSCLGGSIDGPYQWLQELSLKGEGISYETAQPYLACSSDSKEGFCPHVDTACNPLNVARTCGSFSSEGGPCTGLEFYPNISISEYGSISGAEAMMAEIYAHGPITCGIDATPLLNYKSGVVSGVGNEVNYVVSVVGWGTDPSGKEFWIVRNSWGEFWGDMGFAKVARGALLLEDQCAWAQVKSFTAAEFGNQVHCHEGGDNCAATEVKHVVV